MVLSLYGLDSIDRQSTRKVLKQLINIVRVQRSRATDKSLFATNGMAQSLEVKASEGEPVDASRMVQDRPSESLPGTDSLERSGHPQLGGGRVTVLGGRYRRAGEHSAR